MPASGRKPTSPALAAGDLVSPLLEAPQRAPAPARRTGGHQQAGHEHPRAVSLAIVSPVRHSPCTARTLCPLCRPRTTPSPPRRPSRLRLSRPTRSACWCSPPRGGTWAGAAARMAQQVGVGRASGGECGAAAGRVLCAVRCALCVAPPHCGRSKGAQAEGRAMWGRLR